MMRRPFFLKQQQFEYPLFTVGIGGVLSGHCTFSISQQERIATAYGRWVCLWYGQGVREIWATSNQMG